MAILYPTATEFRKMLADKKTFLAGFFCHLVWAVQNAQLCFR